MSGSPQSQRTPNPARVAFFRSTTWKLLVLADLIAFAVGGAGYYLTNNALAFAPIALVGLLMVFVVVRVASRGASPDEAAADDPIVR